MVSIIILTYKDTELLKVCLESLYKQIAGLNFEVIVVDNNPDRVSSEMLKDKFKKVKVISEGVNLGFAKGINKGVGTAKGEYLLFLNPDTKFIDGTLKEMAKTLEENEKIGVLGGAMENTDGTIQRSCGNFYNLNSVFLMLFGGDRGELLKFRPDKLKEVDWVSGGFMLIRRDLFEKAGGFDEAFFMYIEDMELCYRVKKSGYKIFFYPGIKVAHVGQGSTNRSFAIINIYQNLPYFYKKHRQYWEYLVLKLLLIFKALSAIIIGIICGNSYLRNTYSKALTSII